MNRLALVGAAAIVAAAALTGCSATKDCTPAQLNLPSALTAAEADSMSFADLEWWKVYTDSALVDIITETLAYNRDLLAAAERVEELRQLYGVEKLNLTPELTANAYADRETNDYRGDRFKNDPEAGLKATLSWEADIWGGLSAARRREGARFRASVEQERAIKVMLIAEVASAYFRLIALDNELAIARRTLFTREENLNKARLRYEGGLTPETVYQQAQVEYATTAALIPGLEHRIQVQQNAITLLMGRYPQEELRRSRLVTEQEIPVELPVGLPTDLLRRRPDLRASEADLAAALANVGVAYADRFPRLRVSISGGIEDDGFTRFFASPFTYMIGSIAGTVFDFGKNRRKHRAAVAAYEQARLAYEQDVLEAFTEVRDAASGMRYARQTTVRRRELRDAAKKYAELAFTQYNSGAIAYIDVLDAQRRYFDAQIGLSNALRDQYLAMVYLYRVLGGGW